MGRIPISCKNQLNQNPLQVVVAGNPSNPRYNLLEIVPRVMQDAYNGQSFESCRFRDCMMHTTDNPGQAFGMIQAHSPGLVVVEYSFSGQYDDTHSLDQIVKPARKKGFGGKILCVGDIGHCIMARAAGCDEYLDERNYLMSEDEAKTLGCVTGDRRMEKTIKFVLDDYPFVYVEKIRPGI